MHVVQLGPYPPPEGGISRNILAIRELLRKNGHQCSIIATSKSSKIGSEADVYHPSNPIQLINLLARLKYDVLHVHVGGDIPLRVLAFLFVCSFFGRNKSVFTLHSGGYARDKSEIARPFSLTGFVLRRFNRIIAVNSLMVTMFEKFGVSQENLSLILPFALQNPDSAVKIPPKFREFISKHQPFLLSVSLLEDEYDLPLQIEALEKVLVKFPNAGLIIAGSGSLENELKALLGTKVYAENVFLAGNVEHPITLHLINNCDILLRTTKFDGDAISIREALHLETPVIATDNGMRPDGVKLIPIHNVPALAEMIVSLAQTKRKPKSPQPINLENIEQILRLYEKLVNS
jgi:glycosyltransferase involved in cell wall biosynthesis